MEFKLWGAKMEVTESKQYQAIKLCTNKPESSGVFTAALLTFAICKLNSETSN
jgi:hypothetical protein